MEAHQASSSSSCGSSYEVFLSFNGIDVRTNFADHLYIALVDAGIRTFRDEDELPKGNEIGSELLATIQQSRISIPILSKNYASSKWCLNELTQISECRRTMDRIVLPIFYKVEPKDVRNQTGIYEKAFEKHQKQFNETTVQEWRKSLREVGELDGWHSKEGTYEGKLIKEVVKKVWRTLNKRSLIVSNNLVGIQSHIKEILMLLDIESDNRKIVGIHGIGGIGKTTIARTVYNTVFHHFEGYSFIENIQENAQKHGLPHLQNQLIFDILKQENQNITNVDDGINVIQRRFSQRKVLIVLDDVDQDNQAKSLVGDREWFGIGSKIIITSRNKDILITQKADEIYKPNLMHFDNSLKLFSHHAFGMDQPPEDYLDLSEAMVKTTGGLPLALQVIGSSLHSKGKSVWEGMLTKLRKVPNNDVMKRLKISYDGLDDEEQQMFLDTACFFIGMNKDVACYIWDGCGLFYKVGLHALCVRSLVTISEEGELSMHELLRDLGRHIVREENIDEPGKRSRIWSQEDVLEVLNTQMGTSKVKGLSIDFSGMSGSQCLMSKGFTAMTRLRLLQVHYAHFFGNFTHSFSELRWLCWKGCPDQYAQPNFCPRKLAVLDLSRSEINENWMGWNCIKMAENLKVLSITSCHRLSRNPDLSANQHLEVLSLKHCENLVSLTCCYLKNLVILDMSGCTRLVDLPGEICQLTSLKTLDLTGCKSLVDLSIGISELTSLERLNLRGCKKLLYISLLPSSLTSLDVRHCSSIQYISGLPTSLTKLDVAGCKSMKKLSSILPKKKEERSIAGLRNLERLCLIGCNSLEEIDDEGLDSLVLFTRKKEERSLAGLRNLERLCLIGCNSLEEIEGVDEGLDSLVLFTMSFCPLKQLPNLRGLKKLRKIKLDDSDFISDIEGEGMVSLEELAISSCKSLRTIKRLTDSKMLRSLEISSCPQLSEIECLEDFESLETFTVIAATSLKMLPDVSTLKNLSYLRISRCNSMERIPDLSNLNNSLQVLMIEYCEKFTEIPGLDRLESLRELKIKKCLNIARLDLSKLNNLNDLKIEGCWKVTEIHGVDRFEFLKILHISWCLSLKRLPDLSNLKNLNDLQINGCRNLNEIHGLDRLEILEKLDISWCSSLERLPDLSNLKILKKLIANGCGKLTEIQADNGLESLEILDIRGCLSLEKIPNLTNIKEFWNLDGEDCSAQPRLWASID